MSLFARVSGGNFAKSIKFFARISTIFWWLRQMLERALGIWPQNIWGCFTKNMALCLLCAPGTMERWLRPPIPPTRNSNLLWTMRSLWHLPLRVGDTYPPEPPGGPEHVYDKKYLAQGYVLSVFKPSVVFLKCRDKSERQIAVEIAKNLQKHRMTDASSWDWPDQQIG